MWSNGKVHFLRLEEGEKTYTRFVRSSHNGYRRSYRCKAILRKIRPYRTRRAREHIEFCGNGELPWNKNERGRGEIIILAVSYSSNVRATGEDDR